jgi:hypothetical protein
MELELIDPIENINFEEINEKYKTLMEKVEKKLKEIKKRKKTSK